MKKIVIVESPTKAKTISKFLGKGYSVLSSFGHIRDLPKNETGIDIDHDFEPKYVIPAKSRKIAGDLRRAAKKADEIYFASDQDREGEAIAWHLKQLLEMDPKKTKRISFHEITSEAVAEALEHPREIDMHLVDAQQARRILDRLVGYELSPFLWKKVARGLSAGRVQSVIVRLIVEREREIEAFKPQEYWSVEAILERQGGDKEKVTAKLVAKDGETLDKFALPDKDASDKVLSEVDGAKWTISSIDKKKVKRSPNAPFTTSTLQQEANNKLGYSAKQTMMLAQQLYEGIDLGERGAIGLITYMRTDSVNLSEKFIGEARTYLTEKFDKEVVPPAPRKFKTKAKNAQEAHEAIRPTDVTLNPEEISQHLDGRQKKLYELIWRRAVASQMIDAELSMVAVNIETTKDGASKYTFRANGSTISKKGFLEVYETDSKENLLPEMLEKEELDPESVTPKQHFTEPPPRYTEAALVKSLEENGIGRPSTYAPTISTVQDRGYVDKDGRKLKPTELGLLVTDLLTEHFPDIVDYKFTARMEDNLDEVAKGKTEWVPIIRDFYGPFKKNLEIKDKEISKKDITEKETDEVCEKCEKPMIEKIGRYGKFLACSGFPECRNTKPLGDDADKESEKAAGEKCPKCDKDMVVKHGRFGAFLGCSGYPECKTVKPIQKKTGAKCPGCKEGDIIEKRTRTKKLFYACSRYPECEYALWSRPTGENCPKCGKLVVMAKGDTVKCESKECDFEKSMA